MDTLKEESGSSNLPPLTAEERAQLQRIYARCATPGHFPRVYDWDAHEVRFAGGGLDYKFGEKMEREQEAALEVAAVNALPRLLAESEERERLAALIAISPPLAKQTELLNEREKQRDYARSHDMSPAQCDFCHTAHPDGDVWACRRELHAQIALLRCARRRQARAARDGSG